MGNKEIETGKTANLFIFRNNIVYLIFFSKLHA